MSSPHRAVLVTGASSGIGRATAELLASAGFRVLAGVRSLEGEGARFSEDSNIEPVLLDVTRTDHIDAVVERIRSQCGGHLYGLVNNAGVAPPSAVELADIDEVRRTLEVNTIGPLRLIQACLPMIRPLRGRIVNISSMNGMLAMPMVGAYCASKYALEALSDVLRVELRPWGVRVVLIRPGQVRTDIFAKAQTTIDERAEEIPRHLVAGYGTLYARARRVNRRGATSRTGPNAIARTVLKALTARRPRRKYVVGLEAIGLLGMKMFFTPRLLDWVMATVMGTKRLATPPERKQERVNPPRVEERRPALPDTLRSS